MASVTARHPSINQFPSLWAVCMLGKVQGDIGVLADGLKHIRSVLVVCVHFYRDHSIFDINLED
jgi:hypothetical protein